MRSFSCSNHNSAWVLNYRNKAKETEGIQVGKKKVAPISICRGYDPISKKNLEKTLRYKKTFSVKCELYNQ